MGKDKNVIAPLDGSFDEVVDSIFNPATSKRININKLEDNMAPLPATQKQLVLDIGVQIEKDVNGIEMGVLENGIPFLTQNGLAKFAGAARSVIYDIAQEWAEHFDDEVLGKNRYSWLRQYLSERGYNERQLYIATKRDGQVHYAEHNAILEMEAAAITKIKSAEIRRKREELADKLLKDNPDLAESDFGALAPPKPAVSAI